MASPAAAWPTTTRFIRFGPGPSAPRSPAVPNSSRPVKASTSSDRGRLAARRPPRRAGRSTRCRVAGVGVLLGPRGDGVPQVGRPAVRLVTAPRRCRPAGVRSRGAASRPASSTSAWLSGSAEMPAARLVTSEMPSTSQARLPGGDRLQRGGHADQVAAEHPGHPHLGRASRTAARGTARRRPRAGPGRPSGPASRSRREYASVRSTKVAPTSGRRAGQVDVVGDQHRGARAPSPGSGRRSRWSARRSWRPPRRPSGRRARPACTPRPS